MPVFALSARVIACVAALFTSLGRMRMNWTTRPLPACARAGRSSGCETPALPRNDVPPPRTLNIDIAKTAQRPFETDAQSQVEGDMRILGFEHFRQGFGFQDLISVRSSFRDDHLYKASQVQHGRLHPACRDIAQRRLVQFPAFMISPGQRPARLPAGEKPVWAMPSGCRSDSLIYETYPRPLTRSTTWPTRVVPTLEYENTTSGGYRRHILP